MFLFLHFHKRNIPIALLQHIINLFFAYNASLADTGTAFLLAFPISPVFYYTGPKRICPAL